LKQDDVMPAARPEFTHLSEAEVLAALAGDGGPVVAEVGRLIAEHTKRLKARADREKPAPGVLVKIETRCAIERVAVLMMARFGAGVSVVTVN
jgi:hypothetical protein